MASSSSHRLSAFNAVVDRITHDRLKATVAPLGQSMSALVQMHQTPDPTRPRAYNDKRVIETAAKLDERRKQTFANIQSVLKDELRTLQSRINEKVKLVPNEHAQEIRAVFRAMNDGDRLALLAQLATKNNGPALAAITEVPSLLTGVSEHHQKQFRDLIIKTHAREEFQEQAALMDAFDVAMNATDVAATLVQDMNDPGRLAEINRGVSAAAEAEAAFNNPQQT